MYVGRTTSSPPGRRQREAAVERRVERSGTTSIRSRVEAAVGEPQGELGRARAGRDQPVEPGEQRLEVDVPDPRDVTAVGDRVVQRDHRHARSGAVDERPDRLVRARRVLDQQHQQPPVADRDPLEPPEGSREPLEARPHVVEPDARAHSASDAAAERVVDVVEAREAAARSRARPPARRA